jgi:hypothetical protein
MSIRRVPGVSLTAVLLLLMGSAAGQSFLKSPQVNVFAGYSLLRYDAQPWGFSGPLNLHGGNLELSLPIYQGWGLVADVSGHYSDQIKEFNFLIGPEYRIEFKGMHFFGRGFWGKSRTRLLVLGASQLEPSSLGYSGGGGGGIDIPLGGRFSIRPIQADYLVTSAFGNKRSSVRYSTGLVVTFGKSPKAAPSF